MLVCCTVTVPLCVSPACLLHTLAALSEACWAASITCWSLCVAVLRQLSASKRHKQAAPFCVASGRWGMHTRTWRASVTGSSTQSTSPPGRQSCAQRQDLAQAFPVALWVKAGQPALCGYSAGLHLTPCEACACMRLCIVTEWRLCPHFPAKQVQERRTTQQVSPPLLH